METLHYIKLQIWRNQIYIEYNGILLQCPIFAIFPFILFFNIPVMYLFPTNCSSVTLLCYWGISLISLVLQYDIYLMKIFPFTRPHLCTIQDYFMIPFSHYHKHNCWLVGTHSFRTNTTSFFVWCGKIKKGEE